MITAMFEYTLAGFKDSQQGVYRGRGEVLGGKHGFGQEGLLLLSRDFCGGQHWCQKAHWLVLPPRKVRLNGIQLMQHYEPSQCFLVTLAAVLQGGVLCFGVFCSPITFNKQHGKTINKVKLWHCSSAQEQGKKCCGVIKTKKYVTLYVTVVLNQTQMCIWVCNC